MSLNLKVATVRKLLVSSRLVETTYLFANLVALVYNIFNSFGLGYYKLLKIPLHLSSIG